MYNTLMQLKKMYKRELWMKMVEQAKERGKITDEEYERLIFEEEVDEA
nr:MAG TPA: Short C-terminal domain [Caudoviricetes sp.]